MIETCKVNRLEPYGYLVALFRALSLANTADEYPALLLWRAHLNTLTHGRAPRANHDPLAERRAVR
ncbi:transposase domain-containing protein [Mycetohabitans rhizoxinica]|uniref:transposase domain-containing protein n=1 Tax=Mycetohabitans rhizoxinica TaxID=412963 RepID=UPI0030D31285